MCLEISPAEANIGDRRSCLCTHLDRLVLIIFLPNKMETLPFIIFKMIKEKY